MVSLDYRWRTPIANEIKPSEKPAQGIGSVWRPTSVKTNTMAIRKAKQTETQKPQTGEME
jgi:hypothetical protein